MLNGKINMLCIESRPTWFVCVEEMKLVKLS